MKLIIIILLVTGIIAALRLFKKPIRKWMMNLRAKLHIRSLRKAIEQADKNKEETDRKNMVVFNSHAGDFEPIEKKLLKKIAHKNKNKNNAAMTDGRKWYQARNRKKKHYIDTDKVKSIEKKSLYVTD